MGIFINTCLSEIMIGLVGGSFEEGQVEILDIETWQADRQESKKLMPKIVDMLKRNGYEKKDLESVYLVTGPGSFTAVRIGFIVGKALVDGLGLKMRVSTTFEFLQDVLDEDKYDFAMLNAGGKMVYEVDLQTAKYEMKNVKEVDMNDKVWIDISKKQAEFLEIDGNDRFGGTDGFNLIAGLEGMDLVLELDKLEPNYVKEANIT